MATVKAQNTDVYNRTQTHNKKYQDTLSKHLPKSPKAFSSSKQKSEKRLDLIEVGSPRLQPFQQSTAFLINDPKQLSKAAETFKESNLTESEYLTSLKEILNDYLVLAKDEGYPTGLNVEITNALLGDNPHKIALISESNPKINFDGELVDSWDTPYFFHSHSLTQMDIRSAGPDQTMFTKDDVVLKHPSTEQATYSQ
ncbi:MAG: hypothetical protein NE334_18900 [Lentisphaeraceae bacterium]|nr:hypothetical protein [Lentisphaeraceae bacterium]